MLLRISRKSYSINNAFYKQHRNINDMLYYISHILGLFVDVGNNYSVLDHPNICFIYEYVGSKDSEREQSSFVSNVLPVMLLLLIKDATCIPIKKRFQKKILKTVLHLLNADGRKSGEGPRGGNKTQHTIFMLHDVTSLYNVHSRD